MFDSIIKPEYSVYAKTKDGIIVSEFYSTAFHEPNDGDILVETGNQECHVYPENKWIAYDKTNMVYNYTVVNGKVTPINNMDKINLKYSKDRILSILSKVCSDKICEGVKLHTKYGLEEFSFKKEDQINMVNLLNSNKSNILYHSNGNVDRLYSADEFLKIYDSCINNLIIHKNYFNHLKQWVLNIDNTSDLYTIYYGIKLPVKYREDFYSKLHSIGIDEVN